MFATSINEINIFIIRHGESEGNVDRKVYQQQANRLIELSNLGYKQAKSVGVFLAKNYTIHKNNSIIITSSFKRAFQTAESINNNLKIDMKTDDRIVERNFGLFEGLSKKECLLRFPEEALYFFQQKELNNTFFTTALMGESPANVAIRFQLFWKDFENFIKSSPHLKNVIIVAHGITNLIMQKELMNYSIDWFEKRKHSPNCAITKLVLNLQFWSMEDCGIIFTPELFDKNKKI